MPPKAKITSKLFTQRKALKNVMTKMFKDIESIKEEGIYDEEIRRKLLFLE